MAAFICLAYLQAGAQHYTKVYKIKDGRMYIMLSKHMPEASLDSFIENYNLQDLNLKNLDAKKIQDSLIQSGWKLELNNDELIAVSKKIGGIDNIANPAISISINGRNNLNSSNNEVKLGINKFKNKPLFAINDSVVTFFLRNHSNAKKVILAGSFNDWSETALAMNQVSGGWAADVKLAPGKHSYKFIVDGNWEIDRDNKLVENDGKGNDNSIFFKPNYVFRSHRFLESHQLYIAGSFNNWNDKEIPLAKVENGWAAAVYLAEGTYTYRFIADGKWSDDPENKDRFPNEFGEYNSVMRLGDPHVFKLAGFSNAEKAELVGSFNHWREGELLMSKTPDGWELPYTIGAGNYEYAFKINGLWVSNNGTLTKDAGKANYYSLVLHSNYTFRLQGFADAKKVFIAGDFNNWSPDTYPLSKTGNEWIINMHLNEGKHLYKFIVDGKWILDPGNTLWEQNNERSGNSVLWIGQ